MSALWLYWFHALIWHEDEAQISRLVECGSPTITQMQAGREGEGEKVPPNIGPTPTILTF